MVYPHSYRTEHSETKTTNSVYGDYYASTQSSKIHIQPQLLKILQFVDSNRTEFLDDLEEAVKIKSISSKLAYQDDSKKMIKFVENWLDKLDVKYECFNIGYHVLEGKKVRLPPIILGRIGNDPKKKTICASLHVDVLNPCEKPWSTDPWQLHRVNNKNYGCGSGCGKGPLMCWFHVLQAFKFCKMELPVNLKFIIESMYHSDSQGLADFVATRSQDFFANVELVIEVGSEWLGEKHPCITYGTVGILHFHMQIDKVDGSKTEIKDDMNNIFKTIVDEEGNVIINGFNDYVEQVTPDEERMYENIDFDVDDVRESLPPHKQSWDKVRLLMSFWRLPSIYVGDTEECICEKNDKNVVKRNFIVKLVPKQTVDSSVNQMKNHIQACVKKLNIENKVSTRLVSSTRPWCENVRANAYQAARRAIIQIYKEDPNLIREDRPRLTATIFDNVLEKSMLLLPLCSRGSNLGQADENISNKNYYEGTKLIGAFLFQYASPRVN
ncbi:unnamed protein product [Acanthoscelides obtectus]|uniref:Cytosolic non-specific dipeptidase n=1 Tax=Acanthoscelides obtectus TaxID=200917 RepID=A0A9P0L1R9_ACAOB|nr:unnamed protein product [Acanthoscelides obtectus]CAK1619871.1 Beta-Ala-His dipeptidase [Acanthoscelides obtectus]